ncbi:MAG: hypothetical protein ACRD5H_05405 [Nitrososphaerales archaeon]
MKEAVGIIVTVLFSFWFVISVASQFSDKVAAAFPRMSMFALIPAWTFFAPRPGVHDLHLLYRDRAADGTEYTVSYIPTIPGRRWFHAIWNPYKYHNKIVSDCSDSLLEQFHLLKKSAREPRIILLSTPYLMLLNIVMRMPSSTDAVARQFIIAQNTQCASRRERDILFISEFHKFDGVLT